MTATDPDQDPVTFPVTPVPAHVAFHRQTDVFTFAPDTTLIGPLPQRSSILGG